jgi:uncharacterized integral membrane protein
MNRCKDCAGLIYGDDNQCASCRNHEWAEQVKRKRMIQEAKAIVQEINDAHRRKQKALMTALHNGFIFAILVILFLAVVDATKVAVNYELRKPEILRQHGVK